MCITLCAFTQHMFTIKWINTMITNSKDQKRQCQPITQQFRSMNVTLNIPVGMIGPLFFYLKIGIITYYLQRDTEQDTLR